MSKQKASNGDGSVVPAKDKEGKPIKNKWLLYIPTGWDPFKKKYTKKKKTFYGTKTEAKQEIKRLISDQDQGINLEGDSLTFGEFAATWLENYKRTGNVKEDTFKLRKGYLQYCCKFIGHMRIKDITIQTLESMETAILKQKEFEGNPIGNTTLQKYYGAVKSVLKKAVDYDFITKNPCDRMTAPKTDKPKRRSLTAAETSQFIKALDETHRETFQAYREKEERHDEWGKKKERSFSRGMSGMSYCLMPSLALATGMRRGEIIGLTWGSVDLAGKKIKVKQMIDKSGKEDLPKTDAGNRTISIDQKTTDQLKEWKAIQSNELAKFEIKQDKETPVFCNDLGKWVNGDNFSRWWGKFRKGIGFADLKFHELRHTHATLLLANGAPVKTVQERLGHADVSITLNHYAHAIPKNDEQAAELMGNILEFGADAKVVEFRSA